MTLKDLRYFVDRCQDGRQEVLGRVLQALHRMFNAVTNSFVRHSYFWRHVVRQVTETQTTHIQRNHYDVSQQSNG